MSLPQRNETGGGFIVGNDNLRAILVFLGIGLVAGFLASLVVGGGGLLTYLVSGVIGSFVGGYLFSALNINLGIKNDLVRQIITSTVGAIIVVIIARLIA
ncbi:GlsB/YeaQ/YmgE family stress response membrane protein [Devosia nitrariae]|uniref:GlsB/YeaQ/YmgE family stress response membrane protein n=1 Tax=Devosia nitrariae TaxID=2071872 RepID=UPI0024E14B5A|nr:GlsB/YeaQ/YmgE family stress response membrane protein [Devosia nitrariae]